MISDSEVFFAKHPDREVRERGLALISLVAGYRDEQIKRLETVQTPRLHAVVDAHVMSVLKICGGNELRASKVLGISRETLRRHTKKCGMRINAYGPPKILSRDAA